MVGGSASVLEHWLGEWDQAWRAGIRLAAGEDDLARLAADLGFTAQSHLNRGLRSETDVEPSVLRRLLT